MRRAFGALLVVAVASVGAIGAILTVTGTSCGCAAPPSPPSWPVAPSPASEAVARLAGAPPGNPPAWTERRGERLWVFSWGDGAASRWSLVDADDGRVLAYLDAAALPEAGAGGLTEDAAIASATGYFAARSIGVAGLTPVAVEAGVAGAPAYIVEWRDAKDTTALEVGVSATDGMVFWYADRRGTPLALRTPLVAGTTAASLAERSGYAATDLGITIEFAEDGTERATWWLQVTAIGSSGDGSSDGALTVDALTGQLRLGK